jgi:hypothetical protein
VVIVFDLDGLSVFSIIVEDFFSINNEVSEDIEFLGFTVFVEDVEEALEEDFEGNELTLALTLA